MYQFGNLLGRGRRKHSRSPSPQTNEKKSSRHEFGARRSHDRSRSDSRSYRKLYPSISKLTLGRKTRIKIIVPSLNGAVVNFRAFMETQTQHIDEERALKVYHKYRDDYFKKQH